MEEPRQRGSMVAPPDPFQVAANERIDQ